MNKNLVRKEFVFLTEVKSWCGVRSRPEELGIVSPKPSSLPAPVMGIPSPDTDIALHKVKPLREQQTPPAPPTLSSVPSTGRDGAREMRMSIVLMRQYVAYTQNNTVILWCLEVYLNHGKYKTENSETSDGIMQVRLSPCAQPGGREFHFVWCQTF